jgi:hypothetical protein
VSPFSDETAGTRQGVVKPDANPIKELSRMAASFPGGLPNGARAILLRGGRRTEARRGVNVEADDLDGALMPKPIQFLVEDDDGSPR